MQLLSDRKKTVQLLVDAGDKVCQEADRAKSSPREELKVYLTASLEHTEDTVGWWGICL